MKSLTRFRAATISALSLVLSVGMAAGCGGDGDAAGPEDAFVGYWFAESPTTGFTVTCTDTIFSQVFTAGGDNQLRVFEVLKFEHGELTDLAETSGSCNLLTYDIKGDSATVVNPDPYDTGTDPVAGCVTGLPLADMAGKAIPADMRLRPDASWTVKRLAEKTAAGADRLQLAGTASARLRADDGSGTGNIFVSNPECTYGGMDTFFRLTRP